MRLQKHFSRISLYIVIFNYSVGVHPVNRHSINYTETWSVNLSVASPKDVTIAKSLELQGTGTHQATNEVVADFHEPHLFSSACGWKRLAIVRIFHGTRIIIMLNTDATFT